MKTRKNETEILANQLMQLQTQSLTQMIDLKAVKQVQSTSQNQQITSSVNLITDPLSETKKFINDNSINSLPSFTPPTFQEALQLLGFPESQKIFSNSYSNNAYLGKIVNCYQKPVKINQFTKKQLDIASFNVVTAVFSKTKNTIQQLRIQQQMFKATDPLKLSFKPIPAFLNSEIVSFLPIPPIDVKPHLAMILTLLNVQTPLTEGICAWFLNTRMMDLLESLFWLFWAVIFDGKNSRIPFSEFNIPQKTWDQPDILPDHLNIQQLNLSLVSFLQNRISDDYATIQRAWMGCRGSQKDLIQEYLPYFISNAIHRLFLRTFPQFSHVFSPKFVENLFNNVTMLFSGMINYPDYQKAIITSLFGDNQISSVSYLTNTLPSGSPLIGSETLDQVNLASIFHGRYTNSTSEITENMKKTAQFYKTDEQNQNQLDEGAITYSQIVKPIDFDFIIFDELINSNNNYSIYRSAVRNQQVMNKLSTIKYVTPNMLFQSNQDTLYPSLTKEMNNEAVRVVRHAVPRSTLSNLSNYETKTVSKASSESRILNMKKGKENAKIFELEDVTEPKVRYTQIQFDELKSSKKAKKSYKYEEMVQNDMESYKSVETAEKLEELSLTQLANSNFTQKSNSCTIDNTFVIRLPPKYRKFSPKHTQISQLINNEQITNNDIVINMHDESYENLINSTLNSVHTTHNQPVYHPLPPLPKRTEKPFENTEAIEILRSHPLRITNQKIFVSSVSPLLLHYLQISGAPAPADFKNLIQKADINAGKSDFVKQKEARLHGESGNSVSQGFASIRAVNVVRRTRNDAWVDPVKMFVDEDESERVSKNQFVKDYEVKKGQIGERRRKEKQLQKDDFSELEVQKTLFLDGNLKGKNTRVAALSKVVVQEVEDQKKLMDVAKGDQAQEMLLEMRDGLKSRLKGVDMTEKIAKVSLNAEKKRKEKGAGSSNKLSKANQVKVE